MDASGLLSFAYSINFQIRQISAKDNHFSCKKSLLFLRVKISEKKKSLFSGLRSRCYRQANITFAFTFHQSHLHFSKVGELMLLKYGNLMLPAGYILDLYCVQLSNTAPFCENYTQLYFNAKHLKKRLNNSGWGGVKFLVLFFQEKCLFWPISNAALNFQNIP